MDLTPKQRRTGIAAALVAMVGVAFITYKVAQHDDAGGIRGFRGQDVAWNSLQPGRETPNIGVTPIGKNPCEWYFPLREDNVMVKALPRDSAEVLATMPWETARMEPVGPITWNQKWPRKQAWLGVYVDEARTTGWCAGGVAYMPPDNNRPEYWEVEVAAGGRLIQVPYSDSGNATVSTATDRFKWPNEKVARAALAAAWNVYDRHTRAWPPYWQDSVVVIAQALARGEAMPTQVFPHPDSLDQMWPDSGAVQPPPVTPPPRESLPPQPPPVIPPVEPPPPPVTPPIRWAGCSTGPERYNAPLKAIAGQPAGVVVVTLKGDTKSLRTYTELRNAEGTAVRCLGAARLVSKKSTRYFAEQWRSGRFYVLNATTSDKAYSSRTNALKRVWTGK